MATISLYREAKKIERPIDFFSMLVYNDNGNYMVRIVCSYVN